MRAENLLAKLTARGLVISGDVGGAGSVGLDRMDVAAALAMMPTISGLLLLTVFCDDHKGDRALLGLLADEIQRTARSRIVSRSQAEQMAFLALFEACRPKRCQPCAGRGELLRYGVAASDCPTCDGTGRAAYSVRERAALAQVPRSTFGRAWKSTADEACAMVERYIDQGLRSLVGQLRDAA